MLVNFIQKITRGSFFILICLMMLTLCACDSGVEKAAEDKTDSASSPNGAPAASAAPSPRYGGQMVMASIGEPSGLISILTTDSSSHEVAAYFYVGCLRYNKDLEIEPWAAESYEVLDDGRLLRLPCVKVSCGKTAWN